MDVHKQLKPIGRGGGGLAKNPVAKGVVAKGVMAKSPMVDEKIKQLPVKTQITNDETKDKIKTNNIANTKDQETTEILKIYSNFLKNGSNCEMSETMKDFPKITLKKEIVRTWSFSIDTDFANTDKIESNLSSETTDLQKNNPDELKEGENKGKEKEKHEKKNFVTKQETTEKHKTTEPSSVPISCTVCAKMEKTDAKKTSNETNNDIGNKTSEVRPEPVKRNMTLIQQNGRFIDNISNCSVEMGSSVDLLKDSMKCKKWLVKTPIITMNNTGDSVERHKTQGIVKKYLARGGCAFMCDCDHFKEMCINSSLTIGGKSAYQPFAFVYNNKTNVGYCEHVGLIMESYFKCKDDLSTTTASESQ